MSDARGRTTHQACSRRTHSLRTLICSRRAARSSSDSFSISVRVWICSSSQGAVGLGLVQPLGQSMDTFESQGSVGLGLVQPLGQSIDLFEFARLCRLRTGSASRSEYGFVRVRKALSASDSFSLSAKERSCPSRKVLLASDWFNRPVKILICSGRSVNAAVTCLIDLRASVSFSDASTSLGLSAGRVLAVARGYPNVLNTPSNNDSMRRQAASLRYRL